MAWEGGYLSIETCIVISESMDLKHMGNTGMLPVGTNYLVSTCKYSASVKYHSTSTVICPHKLPWHNYYNTFYNRVVVNNIYSWVKVSSHSTYINHYIYVALTALTSTLAALTLTTLTATLTLGALTLWLHWHREHWHCMGALTFDYISWHGHIGCIDIGWLHWHWVYCDCIAFAEHWHWVLWQLTWVH